MSKTIIFTDGSSRGNPGPGGYGAIIGYVAGKDKRVKEIGGGEKSTTNNRMEMTAVIEGIITAKKLAPGSDIAIYTDSEYVKKGATMWAYSWASNNWMTKANAPVLNKDLWQKMLSLIEDVEIDWKVIPGHSGIPANERCDVIATSFADNNHPDLYDGPYADYGVSFEIKSALTAPKGKSGSSAGKKAYSYVSSIRGQVQVHKTWGECEARVKGEPNARYRKALTKDDELMLIKEFSK
jgi:ribonuclease HI